jgi:hypothetical protein
VRYHQKISARVSSHNHIPIAIKESLARGFSRSGLAASLARLLDILGAIGDDSPAGESVGDSVLHIKTVSRVHDLCLRGKA